ILPTMEAIDEALREAHRGEIVREGFRIVLAGPPNAGKSSLLNALARRDVAIVSPEAGTTRDVLEARLDLGGYAVLVADTAGLRYQEDAGAVEREGMRRTRARMDDADLIVWMVDATAPVWKPPAEVRTASAKTIVVLNKADLAPDAVNQAKHKGLQAISALKGDGIASLLDLLGQEVATRLDATTASDSAIPTRLRHRKALEACCEALRRFAHTSLEATPELAAEDLRLATDALGRITGRIDAEQVLGAIFGRFCIGK
ncbi:MAG: tRNA modification GTPase, partial [Hyphomicrobiaceae bacterium]